MKHLFFNCNSMEEEMTMEVQGDPGSSEGESGGDTPTSRSAKRARGRPKGSKKLQVWVTHVDLSEFGSGISNGGPTPPLKSRGRPKGSANKHKVQKPQQDSLNPPRGRGRPKSLGLEKLTSSEETSEVGQSTRKRGRPKGSPNKKTLAKCTDGSDDWDFTIDGSLQPKKGRGRPKKSTTLKRSAKSSKSEEEEDAGESGPPRKRGRPKGSPNKKPWLAVRSEVSSEDWESESDLSSNSQSPVKRGRGRPSKSTGEERVVSKQTIEDSSFQSSPRGRGRPRKAIRQRSSPEQRVSDGSQPTKRGPGRPKGSLNKTYPLINRSDRLGRPWKPNLPFMHTERLLPKPKGRGRPKKELQKRGRPRKYPLPPPGELMRPKVWKPLGRPRKYPRVDPPGSPVPAPRRPRGRPRKPEIKRGVNLRKVSPTQPSVPSDGRPRGRPLGTVKEKRGRPKGSLNKPKVVNKTLAGDKVTAAGHQSAGGKQVHHEAEEWEEEDAGENIKGIAPLEENEFIDNPAE